MKLLTRFGSWIPGFHPDTHLRSLPLSCPYTFTWHIPVFTFLGRNNPLSSKTHLEVPDEWKQAKEPPGENSGWCHQLPSCCHLAVGWKEGAVLPRDPVSGMQHWQQQLLGSVFCMVFTNTSAEIQLCALAEFFNCMMFQNCLLKPQLNHQNSEIRLFALNFHLCLNTRHKSDSRGVTPHLTEAR